MSCVGELHSSALRAWPRSILSLILCGLLGGPSMGLAQDTAASAASAPKYKLTIVEGASTSKRVKKGRVSSQSVVKITDQNDVPVAGIAVTFTIPQFAGATFANGALTSLVSTNAAGLASSTLTATAGSSFSVGVVASVPGGALTGAVPVSASAAAAAGAGGAAGGAAAGGAGAGAGAGISTGVIVGIVAGVGAVAAAGIAVGLKSSGGGNPSPSTGAIGAPGAPTFGHP